MIEFYSFKKIAEQYFFYILIKMFEMKYFIEILKLLIVNNIKRVRTLSIAKFCRTFVFQIFILPHSTHFRLNPDYRLNSDYM